jgi:hypothetical protein
MDSEQQIQNDGRWRQRTPAMAAGLMDQVWSPDEWMSFPAVQYNQDTTNDPMESIP